MTKIIKNSLGISIYLSFWKFKHSLQKEFKEYFIHAYENVYLSWNISTMAETL